MFRYRWIWSAVCVAMGVLQAWDSGVLRSPAWVQLLVAVAIAAPALTYGLTRSYGAQALSIAAAFVLLTTARIVSPVPLPTLLIVALVPAVLIFFPQMVKPDRPEPAG